MFTPPVQVYVTAPLAVSVVEFPGQMPPEGLLFTTFSVGVPGTTVTVIGTLELQPSGVRPLTV